MPTSWIAVLAGILRETIPNERRVSVTPSAAATLIQAGLDVVIEKGAGAAAGFVDTDYESKGARTVDRARVFEADVLLEVRASSDERLRKGQTLIGLADPLMAADEVREMASRGVTLFALELLPRTTLAQPMDVLSSMATVAGYKAVLVAAERSSRMFPMMVTAAGTLAPARVLVIGAGVAGLQAIATARRLGAVVSAYDVRPEVQEEVESLGARFAEMPLETADAQDERGYAKALGEAFYEKQREHMVGLLQASDVVITTAAVPGKKAPRLITAAMVEAMAPGSMIVDLAAATGGNCELTVPDESVEHHGVLLLGPTNLPGSVPMHASQMYARNITAFLLNMSHGGRLEISLDDEIVKETLVIRDGDIVHPRVLETLR